MIMKKRHLYAGLAFALLISCNACGNRHTDNNEETIVRLYTVGDDDMPFVSEYPGRVKASEEVNLAFKVSGTLRHVYVNEGSRVRKGELVAEMDPRDYQVQHEATEAEYLKVKAEAERVIALYKEDVSSADAYDKARYSLRQITAKYENAKNQLADTKIYAPFSGYVQERMFDPPTVISAGMPVAVIVSDGTPEIEINIPASAYIHRDKLKKFTTSFDFLPGQAIELKLAGIAPKANANQLYTVRLALPAGLSPQPAPGMNVMVKVASDESSQNSDVEIPASAMFSKDGKSCVWVFDSKNGVVQLREVVAKELHTNGMAVIASGLESGESIVSAGVHKLNPGEKVKPEKTDSKTNIGGLL